MQPHKSSDRITDPRIYLNRRNFLRAGVLGASVVATGWIYRRLNGAATGGAKPLRLARAFGVTTAPATRSAGEITAGFRTDERHTPFEKITHYNNFYEFSTDKQGVAPAAADFAARPWKVAVDGLVAKPRTFDLDDLLTLAPIEERIYRMRCVEAWSMVIPWDGYSLSKLLDRVQPRSSAKYVAFTTLLDPKRMPNEQTDVLPWPYVEGLRIDEAMHPLTMLATGIYGNALPPQDGAPVRLVAPWKYGFKGIKSIVKISLVEKQPPNTWNQVAPNEYGFFANVNPNVDHPRWSQATERRLDDGWHWQETLMFNGYAEEVGHLYAGMDLRANF